MKSSFKIDEKKNIIFENLSSDITTEDYIKLKHDEFHHKKFNRNHNLISDFRKCEKILSPEDLQDMINIFKENKGKVNRKKSALIFSDLNRIKKINSQSINSQEIKVFNSIEEALNWALK